MSKILEETQYIASEGIHPAQRATISIITPTKEYTPPLTDYTIDTVKDYVNGNCDTVILDMILPSNVVKDMYQNRHSTDIKFTLTNAVTKSKFNVSVFKAILLPDDEDTAIVSRSDLTASELEKIFIPVTIQLIDKVTELLDSAIVKPIVLEDTDRETALLGLVHSTLHDISTTSDSRISEYVIRKTDNKDKLGRLIIPYPTYLYDICKVFQVSGGGYYLNGINMYIHRFSKRTPVCYIYPPYNILDQAQRSYSGKYIRKLVIVSPKDKALGDSMSPSYYVNSNNVRIIASEVETDLVNNINPPTAVSEPHTPTMVSNPVIAAPGQPVKHKPSAVMTHATVLERADGVAPRLDPSNRRNPYVAHSSLLPGLLDIRVFKWSYSDSSLIVPGMKVDIITEVAGKLITISDAAVIHAHAVLDVRAKGAINSAIETTVITVVLRKHNFIIEELK